MSDTELLSSPPSVQQRRLHLRNTLINPPQLTYGHKPRTPSTSSLMSPVSKHLFFAEDNGWETEDGGSPQEPPESNNNNDNIVTSPILSNSAKKKRNRASTSSIVSTTSTLINTPEHQQQNYHRHQKRSSVSSTSSRLRSPSPAPKTSFHQMYSHRRNRSTDNGASSAKYIEYLEHQVADHMTQLASFTSPTSSTSQAVRLRKLTAEVRALRMEVSEWETNFAIKVKEEASRRVTVNKALRDQVQELEMKLKEKDENNKTAEAELKDARIKIKELRGVEEENKCLEFRIEALSELLADSTGAAQQQPPSSACSLANISRRSSMNFPKRASSLSSSSTASIGRNRRESVQMTRGDRPVSSDGCSYMEDYGITDPIERTLSKLTSASSEASQASSAAPFVQHLAEASTPSLRARRMRRFPPGSSAPQTLILPSAAVVPPPASSSSSAKSFFPMPIGEASASRPSTACSISTVTTAASSVFMQSNNHPGYGHNRSNPGSFGQHSLFAELARAQISPSAPSTAAGDDLESESTYTTRNSSPTRYQPPENRLSSTADRYQLVSTPLNNSTPFMMKAFNAVGSGIASPTKTFFFAKRKAMDMLRGVVGKGVERVSRKKARVMQTKVREARRRKEEVIEEKSRRCTHCDHPQGKSCCGAGKPPAMQNQHAAPVEDAVENIWLWVRFMVALVVAVGVAVKEGPATVLAVDGVDYDHVGEEEREGAIKKLKGESRAKRLRRELDHLADERLILERPGSSGGY